MVPSFQLSERRANDLDGVAVVTMGAEEVVVLALRKTRRRQWCRSRLHGRAEEVALLASSTNTPWLMV